MLAHWLYGTLITLAPLRQETIIFLSLSFATFAWLLSLVINSYVFGLLTLVLPNSLPTSDLNSKIFLGTFVWSILLIYPNNSKLFFNINCQAWRPQFLVSYGPTNLAIKFGLPQIWHITYFKYKTDEVQVHSHSNGQYLVQCSLLQQQLTFKHVLICKKNILLTCVLDKPTK